ncbi:MAG: glutamate-ammonia-ligase adenylyltransferase [Candidatus Azotimanducaceae bacterium]|jgi:glutamate-ammonia-ligase adenylyltransferase
MSDSEVDELDTRVLDIQASLSKVLETPDLEDLVQVSSLSEYFYRFVQSHTGLDFAKNGRFLWSAKDYAVFCKNEFFETKSLNLIQFDIALRDYRKKAMCRIIFRDFTRRADLVETTSDLSDLADDCIEIALRYHYENNLAKYGTPLNLLDEQQRMSVLALGKLGARELNLSSDIDLMFFYGESGAVKNVAKKASDNGKSTSQEISNQEFFLKTARQIVKSLDAVSSEGFVFRVDMRLRPYGESSPLIVNQASLQNYYVEQGRDWERYAFVKARAVAGDIVLGESFLAWMLPFIYRKQLDYGAIESLREMKGLINFEVTRKDLQNDIKLGPGGIRELEFIVQAQQLVWGGKNVVLQERRFLEALEMLGRENLLPLGEVGKLEAAYVYLRNTEHAMQGENDKQTQKLPANELSKQRLARIMGRSNYDDFLIELNAHRAFVSSCFSDFLGANNAEKEIIVEGNLHWVSIWRNPELEESADLLEASGYQNGLAALKCIASFGSEHHQLQDIAANRLHKIGPILLSLCSSEKRPNEALERCLKVFDAIVRRSTYLAFLLENKDAMKRLVHLCAMSPWLTDRVSKFPILLYEFTDKNLEEMDMDPACLKESLKEIIDVLPEDDLEGQMDALRQFRHAASTKVAISELLNLLPVMKASDYLTKVAELVLDKSVDLAFSHLLKKHGEPCDRHGRGQGRCFAVIAYGKMGGIELAYGSDLDLVFLHDADIQGQTKGEKSVPNNVFFSRLGQRIIHILSSFTRFGLLYEIDLRLRPDGNKGPLVGTFNAYERYLGNEAWTWEHQALVRARFVAGNEAYKTRFEEIRQNLISSVRDKQKLQEDVRNMRERMRLHLETKVVAQPSVQPSVEIASFDIEPFDLKHGVGAIIDIEFLVQYWVLAHGHGNPTLGKWTDKVRLLESLALVKLISPFEAEVLNNAYLAYRAALHYTWLGGQVASYDQLNNFREEVLLIWRQHMLD